MPLSPDIRSAAESLHRGSQSIAAVTNNKMDQANRFSRALEALERLSSEREIPIAIVGGLGAIRYGYPTVTEDIDVAVARDQLDSFLRVAKEYGFRIAWKAESGWHTLTHDDVEINIVPEGGKAKNDAPTNIPGPNQLGVQEGLGYATLPRWVELKISSYRRKDQTHIVEVLKKGEPQAIEHIRRHLSSVHPIYLDRFNELATEAAAEKEQENDRGSP